MKVMKNLNRVSVWLVALSLIAFSACNEDEPVVNSEDISEAEDESIMDSNFDEVEDLAFAGIFDQESNLSGGRTENDGRLTCAVVTLEIDQTTEIRTVTIDFGDGCEGPNGRVRKGKIIVTHDGRIWEFDSSISIELVDYSVNDIGVEGTRTITNKTTQGSGGIVHNVTLVGGKITWRNGDITTREVDKTRTWTRDDTNGDVLQVTGGASGTNRKGVSYVMEIVEPITFKRACWADKIFMPVSGIKEITTDRAVVVVDYGDGTCDRKVTITVNGTSRDATIGD